MIQPGEFHAHPSKTVTCYCLLEKINGTGPEYLHPNPLASLDSVFQLQDV